MEKDIKVISTDNAPKAVGPYSQAINCGGFLFISGQMPIDPQNNEMVESLFRIQAEQSMKNVLAILKENNMTVDNLVKTNIYLTDMEKFTEVNDVYKSFFGEYYPARACVEVSKLPKGALVEIEAIAFKG
ncbi:RidA family protein [Anaerosalibacter bizertensis]|uniref:RidA family protein n=1 Tax=Anaerosalibacter bizertensis TaxID=932217 RepID=UPI001D031EA0|nr:RidA family protein [Anaerosalibacter bizertensis]MCB5559185.1 RidA family protein [Anaerosalibacter bizertensis]MCG4586350.1 RidA family protein [Anaerosalibacter bizertensis]